MARSVRQSRALLLLLALLTCGGLYLAHSHGRDAVVKQFSRDQAVLARSAAGQIATTLNQLSLGLNAVADDSVDPQNMARRARHLTILASGYPKELLVSLHIIDHQGNVLVEVPAHHLAQLELPIHQLFDSGAGQSGPRLVGTGHQPLVYLQQPFALPGGGLYAIGALVSLHELCRSALPESQDQPQYSFLFAKTGKLLIHPDRSLIGASAQDLANPEQEPELFELLEKIIHGDPEGSSLISSEQLKLDHAALPDELLLVHAPVNVPGSRWGLALLSPVSGINSINHAHWLSFLILLAGLAAGRLLYRRDSHAPSCAGNESATLNQLRRQLDDAEKRNRQLLDYAGDALFFVTPDNGRIIDLNRAALALLGYSAEELPDVPLSQIFPGTQRHKYVRLVKRVLKSGYAEEGELLIRRQNGEQFTGAIHARLGILGDRQVVHGVLRDVTHLKKIEQELRRRNRDLTLANRIAHQTASISDLNGMLTEALSLIRETFQAQSGGIYLTRHSGHYIHLEAHQNIEAELLAELSELPARKGLIGRVMVSGRPVTSANLRKDRRVWSQAVKASAWKGFQAVPLRASHKIVGVLFLASRERSLLEREDIQLLLAVGQQLGMAIAGAESIEALSWQNRLTQASNRELKASRRMLAENLQRQREETRALEQLEQMKNKFLALASHELRTPLTYIMSGSELLLSSEAAIDNETRDRVLRAIHSGGTRLAEIVDDLLEMARLEAQALYLGQEKIDLEALLSLLHEQLKPDLQQNRLTLDVAPLPPLDDLFGDKDHLGRALRRLLENAVKFTPPGGHIRLSGERRPAEDVRTWREHLESFSAHFFSFSMAPAYLHLTLSDTGIGIDPDEQVKIFEKFYEVGDITEHFTSRSGFGGKGVGLGLALVKGMIEAHGGMIWVTSPGTTQGGSSFHLLLPLRSPAKNPVLSAEPLASSA